MTALLLVEIVALLTVGTIFFRERRMAFAALLAIGLLPLVFGSVSGALIMLALALAVALAQPLYVVLGVITLLCFQFLTDAPPIDYGIFPEKIFELTDKNVLLAIPFFIVSGAIMTQGGIAQRLINVARALTDWLPGGLAIAAIGGCVLFAAISGSSPVTVIAIGGMMYPALVKDNFGEAPSIGLLTAAGSLGIVIPPSIPMIIYAIVVSGSQPVDVGELFLAGVGPGLVIGALLASYVVWRGLRASRTPAADLRRMLAGLAVVAAPLAAGGVIGAFVTPWGYVLGVVALSIIAVARARRAFADGFWALLLPLIILGGIYSGIFTPTEAAAVAVVYSLVVAIYVHRELRWRALPELIVESAVMMGALIIIMVIAFVFNDYLVEEKIPDLAIAVMQQLDLSRAGFLVALNVFLLIVGCFMDIISAILIIAPLIVPMAMAPGIGIDPVHLGIIFIVNLELGYLTPPMGLNLFVASTLFKKPLGIVIRAVAPFTVLMLAGIVIITYVPAVSLGPGAVIAALQADADSTQSAPSATAPSATAPQRVLSIEELMQRSKDDAGAAPAAKPAPGRVLSIEELMRQSNMVKEEENTPDNQPDLDE